MNRLEAFKLANSEHASPEQLRELADHDEYKVRKAVASNPNSPPEALRDLLPYHPNEVLNNAVMPLLRLENPNIVRDWVSAVHPDGDVDLDRKTLLATTSSHPEIMHALATTKQPFEIHNKLFDNENLPSKSIDAILNQHTAETPAASFHRGAAAWHPNTSKKTLEKLLNYDNISIGAAPHIKERLKYKNYKEEHKSIYSYMRQLLEND